MSIGFGATLAQLVHYEELRDDFLFAESIGLDNAWVIDQFAIDGFPEVPVLEAWATLAAVAADTERIRIGSMVTNVASRNPGILAKSILTVDQVSAGRVDVAVGGGYDEAEHKALGLDFLDAVGRGDRLREAVAILDEALRGNTVSHEGVYFNLEEAIFRPRPTQLPRPPLWVAAQAPRSLRVAARHADAVVTLGESEKGIDESIRAFRARMEKLDEICIEEGRDPNALRRCYFAGWSMRAQPTSRSTFTTLGSPSSMVSSPPTGWQQENSSKTLPKRSSPTSDRGRLKRRGRLCRVV